MAAAKTRAPDITFGEPDRVEAFLWEVLELWSVTKESRKMMPMGRAGLRQRGSAKMAPAEKKRDKRK